VVPDECSARLAAASGPLQTLTVAATAHKKPAAIVRPGEGESAMEALSPRNVLILRVFLEKSRRIRGLGWKDDRRVLGIYLFDLAFRERCAPQRSQVRQHFYDENMIFEVEVRRWTP
jgi:hypothetical protein